MKKVLDNNLSTTDPFLIESTILKPKCPKLKTSS
jgi:hypothetical protein